MANPNSQAFKNQAFGKISDLDFWRLSYADIIIYTLTYRNSVNWPTQSNNASPYFYYILKLEDNTLFNYSDVVNVSNTPVNCLTVYTCEGGASRIWGTGKCDKGFFCPVPEKKGSLMEQIKIVNPNYACSSLVCFCPEGINYKFNY